MAQAKGVIPVVVEQISRSILILRGPPIATFTTFPHAGHNTVSDSAEYITLLRSTQ